MLQAIRDRAHGFVAWVIVILISIPFALWGIQEYLGYDPNVPVAEVNGEEILLADFQRSIFQVRAALEQQYPGQDAARLYGENRIRQQALEQLIQRILLLEAAQDAGFTVTDRQVVSAIRGVASFQRDNQFSPEEYRRVLSRNGFTAEDYEVNVRHQLLEGQWRDALVTSALATDPRTEHLIALRAQERTFRQLTIPSARFRDVTIEEEEIANYYDENQDTFMSPDEVLLRYVVLSRAELAAEVEVTTSTLMEYFDSRKASFTRPEQRQVRHILVTPDEEGGEEAAAERARELRDRILVNGEAFEEVAKEASDDPGTGANGGDLGFGGRGVWVPPFEEAAFSLPVGELSEPVQSSFGFHLIEVMDIREEHVPAFEDAREEIEQEYRDAEAEQLYFEQSELLAALTFEHPENLEEAAESLGLIIRDSEPLPRQGVPGDEVFADPAVMQAAFSADVLAGNNSEPVEIEGHRTVVVRLVERREPAQRTLDEVRPEIEAQLTAERALDAAREAGRDILERLRASELPESVVSGTVKGMSDGEPLAWSEEQTISRAEGELAPVVREVLFAMPHPVGGETVYDAVTTGNGDFVVLALRSVEAGEPESLEEIRDALASNFASETYSAFITALRERAEILLHEERLASDYDPLEGREPTRLY